jgi:hypothetical protein
VPTEFFVLFAGLLLVDVVWFLSVYQFTTDRKAFEHQKKWTLNNTIAVFSLLVVIGAVTVLDPNAYILLLWAILALNTLIDFIVSWNFYFPQFPSVD